MVALRVLDEVSWRGTPLPPGRTHALLAALVAAGGRPVLSAHLVDDVWGDDVPANATRALHVVASRLRTQTAPEVVVRAGGGYRLGVARDDVDALVLRHAATAARDAEAAGDAARARDCARAALAVGPVSPTGDGPLAAVRRDATLSLAAAAAVLGRVLSAQGEHAEALPLLDAASADDEATVLALLRSTAAVRGTPAALDRYERHRAGVATRLGVDPGPALQALHAELVAADRPVRRGVRHDATTLVGRDDDVRALRAAVRQARVVSIVGPGGLGKTRLAQVLARGAEQPVVHVVELVGVASPEDLVGELGSALGVRDSLGGRRLLTAEQRGDLRARIAQVLDGAPTLLVLDNCEHLVDAVAGLVAFLVASCPRLHVLTTSRAPLAIAAEQVFALGQLSEDDGAELLRQRALAARPGASIPDDVVRRVVRRLDGLPLALELAAAKVRVLSLEDVDRRLDDRFALLRGGDRSAPDRHATLLAVIDWSWNLLGEAERRALRWLSVFPDGFSLDAAEAVLGPAALDAVPSLLDQSLLTLTDSDAGTRYRMLETVREFGRMQLVGVGEDAAAHAAQLAWGVGFGIRHGDALWSPDQVQALRAVEVEESTLADLLRAAVQVPDPSATVQLTAALATYWVLRGENGRLLVMGTAVDAALTGWQPGADDLDAAVVTAAVLQVHTLTGGVPGFPVCKALLAEHGPAATHRPVAGLAAVVAALDGTDADGSVERLRAVAVDDRHDPASRDLARLLAARFLENAADTEQALEELMRGREDHATPWSRAMTDTFAASLYAQLGKRAEAGEHARAALPVLDALGAVDDAVQVRSLLAGLAIAEHRFDDAQQLLDQIEVRSRSGELTSGLLNTVIRSELALARGQMDEGLRLSRAAAQELAEVRMTGMGEPSGLEPWTLYGEASAVTVHALHAPAGGDDLFSELCRKAPAVLDGDRPGIDYPVVGLVLHGLGVWGLLRQAFPPADAVRLLVLAERFAFPQFTATMDPARTDDAAERAAPGLLAQLREEYRGRRGPQLLPEAEELARRLLG